MGEHRIQRVTTESHIPTEGNIQVGLETVFRYKYKCKSMVLRGKDMPEKENGL